MLDLKPIPVLSDNYVWLVRSPEARQVLVVDPGDASPVLHHLAAHELELAGVLITHHHGDHVGGLRDLLADRPAPVWGPRREHICGVDHPVGDGDSVLVPGSNISLEVIDVPGHTAGHVAYHGGGLVLCGDTLFAGGCGRVFEGTAEQMAVSLARLAALPDATRIACAHEYTVANLEFARAVEPDNPAVAARLDRARAMRALGLPTVPSTLAEERLTNPFLRCSEPTVAEAAAGHARHALGSPVEVFAVLRAWKNAF